MTEKIQTRSFVFGNEKESDWPPLYGTGGSGYYYRDSTSGELREGLPPSKLKTYGKAPMIITDAIDPYYHPGAERWTESKSDLKDLDRATGCITTDKFQKASQTVRKEKERARRKDLRDCLYKAVEKVDSGTHGLSEDVRQLCEKQNEIVSSALNFDAFNVAGKKNNAKGKRYKRRR